MINTTTKVIQTSQQGTASVSKIPYGTYYLYETRCPNGYDIKIQKGYQISGTHKGQVYIGKITIGDTPKVEGNSKDVTYKLTNASSEKGPTVEFDILNRKYINITGYVWEDVPNTKVNTYNNLYDGELKGINNAYSETLDVSSQKEKKITNSIDIGMYTISGSNPIGNVSKSNEKYTITKVDASQLDKAYIIFDYSKYNDSASTTNSQYITCVPGLTGDNLSNTSKALVNEADIINGVNDKDIEEEANTGTYLVTILDDSDLRSKLLTYDTNGVPTIQYINLGIIKIPDTDYTLSNNLSKAIIEVNGYRFTYNYGNNGVENDSSVPNTFPKVNWQGKTDYLAYTRSIYPSDIMTMNSNNENKIKVYVVYDIDITNNTNYYIESLYCEDSLQLEDCWNDSGAGTQIIRTEYDSTRYNESDNNWTEYSVNGRGNAFLRDNEDNPVNKKMHKEIQFEVKDEAILDILNGDTYEKFPTKAMTKAYHNYHRIDNYWKWSGNNNATWKKSKVNHTTISKEKKEDAPYLKFTLSNDRTISGIVFEDSCKNDAKKTSEILGDGIYDPSSENTVRKVKVELFKYENDTLGDKAKLYPSSTVMQAYAKNDDGSFKKDNNGKWVLNNIEFADAEYKTTSKGEYAFKGVQPGEYVIRFTYGNGSQVLYDTNGKKIENSEVYSNDYKSTIVDSGKTKSAYSKYSYDGHPLEDKKYTWYLLDNDKYANKAVDYGLSSERINFDEQSIDVITSDNTAYKTERTATTPQISVPIEFTEKTEESTTFNRFKYRYMSFGIIKKPEVKISIKKKVSNIKVTLQNGQVLTSGNPTQNIKYVANLDQIWDIVGSSNTKIEIDNNNTYGSNLEIEYLLTVTNNSDVTYASEKYYKYGDKTGLQETTVNIMEILEYLDPNLTFVSSDNKTNTITVNSTIDNKYREAIKNVQKGIDGLTNPNNYAEYYKEIQIIDDTKTNEGNDNIINATNNRTYRLYTNINDTDSSKRTEPTSTTVKIIANKLLSAEEEMDYESYAQVSTIQIANNTYRNPKGANAVAEIPLDIAQVTITPSTGLDRSMKYVISATILLICIAGVIVCVKKIK